MYGKSGGSGRSGREMEMEMERGRERRSRSCRLWSIRKAGGGNMCVTMMSEFGQWRRRKEVSRAELAEVKV
jgi:hypothetical protein